MRRLSRFMKIRVKGMRFTRLFGTGLVAMLIAACATTTTGERAARAGDDCMFAVSLRDWRPLDNENLILFQSGRQAYHVELFRPAIGLTRDIMIGVYDRDGRICPYGGDAIIVDGPMPDRIPIRAMRRVSENELDALYVEFGIRPPPVVDTESVDLDTAEQ